MILVVALTVFVVAIKIIAIVRGCFVSATPEADAVKSLVHLKAQRAMKKLKAMKSGGLAGVMLKAKVDAQTKVAAKEEPATTRSVHRSWIDVGFRVLGVRTYLNRYVALMVEHDKARITICRQEGHRGVPWGKEDSLSSAQLQDVQLVDNYWRVEVLSDDGSLLRLCTEDKKDAMKWAAAFLEVGPPQRSLFGAWAPTKQPPVESNFTDQGEILLEGWIATARATGCCGMSKKWTRRRACLTARTFRYISSTQEEKEIAIEDITEVSPDRDSEFDFELEINDEEYLQLRVANPDLRDLWCNAIEKAVDEVDRAAGEQEAEFERWFLVFAHAEDATISSKRMPKVLRSMGVQRTLAQFEEIVAEVGAGSSFDFVEFLQISDHVKRWRIPALIEECNQMLQAFQNLDTQGTGTLSMEEIITFSEGSHTRARREAARILSNVFQDRESTIEFEDFCCEILDSGAPGSNVSKVELSRALKEAREGTVDRRNSGALDDLMKAGDDLDDPTQGAQVQRHDSAGGPARRQLVEECVTDQGKHRQEEDADSEISWASSMKNEPRSASEALADTGARSDEVQTQEEMAGLSDGQAGAGRRRGSLFAQLEEASELRAEAVVQERQEASAAGPQGAGRDQGRSTVNDEDEDGVAEPQVAMRLGDDSDLESAGADDAWGDA